MLRRIHDMCEMTDANKLTDWDRQWVRDSVAETITDDADGCPHQTNTSGKGKCPVCLFEDLIDRNGNTPLPHTFYMGLERASYKLEKSFDRATYNFGFEVGEALVSYIDQRD
jgi:hypothetical protein